MQRLQNRPKKLLLNKSCEAVFLKDGSRIKHVGKEKTAGRMLMDAERRECVSFPGRVLFAIWSWCGRPEIIGDFIAEMDDSVIPQESGLNSTFRIKCFKLLHVIYADGRVRYFTVLS